MRKLLVSAAIFGLVAAFPAAFAQDREHHDQGGQPHGEQHGGPQGGGAPHGAPPGPPPGPRPAAQAQPERGGPPRGGEMRGPREDRPARNDAMRGPEQRSAPNTAMQPPPNAPANAMRGRDRGPANAMRGPGPERRAKDNAMRGPEGRPGPNNAMRGPSRDFSSVRNFHQNFRAERRFHASAYARPRGFYDHRWSWGETLPPFFWTRQYWIIDFMDYDLPPPPYGAIWVRVNDDAVLIDQYSGFIIEVAYGVFY